MDLKFNKNEDHNKLPVAELRKKLARVALGGGKCLFRNEVINGV